MSAGLILDLLNELNKLVTRASGEYNIVLFNKFNN
jgi:hypothetical protein